MSIVTFSVETSLRKGHVFRLNIAECRITDFCVTMLSLGTLQHLGNPSIFIAKCVLYQYLITIAF